MKNKIFHLYNLSILLVFAILLLLSKSSLHAQSFQQPTAEELSMTTDPKAPGVDAVYLYREETADDNLHYHSIYVRLKVLTEKGKELATVKIPYVRGESKIRDLKGRTIHADGTIIPMTVKPSDLMEFKHGDEQVNKLIFTLPSVDVGSIIEYKLDIQYEDNIVYSPQWEVQQPYFVHKAHYKFTPATSGGHWITNSRGEALSRLMYSGHLGNGAKVNEDMEHHYTIDITDVPPTPDEEWAPPLDTIYWHIDFYYTYAFNTNEYWQKEGTVWRKEVERFVKPDKGLREAVGSLVGASDTEEQKAQKLYAAVMKLENTDYTRHKTEAERKAAKQKDIRSAEDVWKQKSGTSDELALLYVSMLSAAGIKAWPMMITDRSRAIFDTNYYSMSQLHDFIAIANISGKDVYLDPGEKFCDYGELGWRHLFTAGFRVSADYKSATLAGTPPGNSYTKAVVQRVADITLDESGNIKGFAQYIMTGPDALKWRHLNLSEGSDEVKKQFNELLHNELPDGVRGELDHFIGIEDSGVNLVAFVNLSGSMGTATGKRTFLPGVFFESRTTNLFVSEAKRLTPVDMHFARMTQDSVNYHLPAGYTVESAPNSNDASWPNSALMRIKSKANGNELNVARVFARNFIFVKDTDYQQLHDFYMKMAAADQQQIVLTRAASAPKGN